MTHTTADPGRHAAVGDLDQVAGVIAVAFADLDVCDYLMPGTDRVTKVGIMAGHLRQVIGHAHRHGQVHTNEAVTAAAAWLDLTSGPLPEIDGYTARRAAICGPYTSRFTRFEDEMRIHHERYTGVAAHWYLALLGVVPAQQGNGTGSALLDQHLRYLDMAGVGSYLEASSTRSRDLYLRHGFLACGDPYPIGPDGPLMHPLWRNPGAASRPHHRGLR